MANNYFEGTGVLFLSKVTPVIEALFSANDVKEEDFDNGEVYVHSDGSVMWPDESLKMLANDLKLGIPEAADDDDSAEVLKALATHFGSMNHPLVSGLKKELPDEFVTLDLEDLVELAKCFDDGHGLTGFAITYAQYCDKPRIWEFGGFGQFVSPELALTIGTNRLLGDGEGMSKALQEDRFYDAAKVVTGTVVSDIAGIKSAEKRARVIEQLLAQLPLALKFSEATPS